MRTLPDIENLLRPLERAISNLLIPSLIGRSCSEAEHDLVALPVCMGGLLAKWERCAPKETNFFSHRTFVNVVAETIFRGFNSAIDGIILVV